MNNERVATVKRDIIAVGRLLWEKGLSTGLNGNISARVDDETILLTASKTCLGLLSEKDLLLANLDGEVLEEGKISSERLMHTEIYKAYPQAQAIIHTHSTYTNAYFLEHDRLVPRIFESKLYLGEVRAIPQSTPSVTDAAPVVAALKDNNVMVLQQHGVVAMGEGLFDCFLLIQCLEEAVKIDAISRIYALGTAGTPPAAPVSAPAQPAAAPAQPAAGQAYPLFSAEQMAAIVEIVNHDSRLQEMGVKTAMTMDLAIRLDETGQGYCFHFVNGRVARMSEDLDAEFLISAPEKIWRAVFARQIDPFVATTQKKMALRGDFARISRWYAPCSRIFELWQQVPVQ